MTAPPREPVAWIQPDHLAKARVAPFLCRVEPIQRDDFVPLYAAPAPSAEPPECDELDRQGGWRRIVPSAEPPAQTATDDLVRRLRDTGHLLGPVLANTAADLIEQQARALAENVDAYAAQVERAERAESALADKARILERCRFVLGNMAQENVGAIFNRWPISHEPLRNDARGLLPDIDAVLGDSNG